MSEEGDKTCPLCAEEMDLTDQQLKPCRCGYEICVWCWHHIMDMAEKDKTEGRCPACRTPYNKERIVGMAADCGKLVAEMSVEKKKSQKGKSKASEGRKQLGSVRVIQKNVVYVVGLPLNLADEDVLQRKEYFGQYGKVHKVSISRTAAGSIQQYPHSTCSVYITYSKEEEAVRCIQVVHGFVLENRPLKACFGTTKYCHAWLRNVPCTNPECLYLHEVGLQEDSYTKDEIVSAYTRVEQITGNTNSMQVRVGNVLPPPADDYCNTSNSSNNPAKVSPPNSSSGRSVGLPAGALWGTRASNNPQPLKQKTDNGPVTFSAAVANQKRLPNGHIEKAESATTIVVEPSASSSMNSPLPPVNNENRVDSPTNATILAEKSCGPSLGKDLDNLCSDVSSMDIKEHEEIICKEYEKSQVVSHEIEDDVVAFNNQRLKDPELVPSNYSSYNLNREASSSLSLGVNFHHVNNIVDTAVKASDIPGMRIEHLFSDDDKMKHMERFQSASGSRDTAKAIGENSIISNILSLDFDPWEEPLSSRQSLAKMLADNDHHQQGSLLSSPRRVHSRFSFAREEQRSQAPYVDPSLSNVTENGHFSHDFTNDRSSHFDKYITHNGFSSVSRPQVSAPPGFSPSNRPPPPGFTSTERVEQSFDPFSGNHLLDTSSLLRNRYQAPTGGNMVSSGDIEFMDPAILAVGKGRLPVGLDNSRFSSQYNTYENEARLQLLMERSLQPQQNQRHFTHLQDAYNIPSRVTEQSFTENLSPFAQLNYPNFSSVSTNGHWKGYNEVARSGNEFAMSELLRNERLGYNNLYAGQEDPKFRIPNSGDIYKRTFGL